MLEDFRRDIFSTWRPWGLWGSPWRRGSKIATLIPRTARTDLIDTGEGKRTPFGIFTERDLLTNFLTRGRSLKTRVGVAASFPLITINLETSIHEAALTMALKRIKRLPVVKDGNIVGIVTARDLVEAYAK